MVQIIPAILSTTEADFERDTSRLKQSSSFKEGWVHIDFADNIFVRNKTIESSVVAKYPIELHKEAHLMVSHPLEWIDDLVETIFERIIFHIEAKDDTKKCIEYIKNKGLQVGLAINNETPIERLEQFIDGVAVVLVMAIVPGFQGQEFIPASLDKIRNLKSRGWKVLVGVDGAVKDDNIKKIVNSGADFVIVGSYLLKGDIDENLENLWERIK
ncbi:MAG: hypothetical protein ACD_37C00036G0003 [uncultured bacterium]|nr:MAG: hypothetical protein ACD_37C00036G0003 [uncultured bacterium]OGE62954.1 MAG: hypothetical protein A2964_01575 [Candidatus Daviesbacteria bacterium RIFCSPLOWO2_01_FULL_40_27]